MIATPNDERGSSNRSQVLASEPQLFVDDMEAALAFYTGKLGFELAFTYGNPAFYAQVVRDAGRLNLRLATGTVYDAEFRQREPDAVCATMALSMTEPLFREYESCGVEFHQRLKLESWGSRTFIVRDPHDNLIAFAGA